MMLNHPFRMASISLAASLALLTVMGCSDRPSRLYPPRVKAATAAADIMAMFDADKNGKISGSEFVQCPSLKMIAKNGEVTAELISAKVAEWQQNKLGRVSASVRILRKGKPLANASIKCAPEKFMGTDIATSVATTDASGAAGLSVPTRNPEEPRGVSPGFYRLEVTKDGESIPGKYNTETTLRVAVLDDECEVSFNLDY